MALPHYIPRYTVTDYRSWPGDWELWNGVAVAMSPSADAVHQALVGRLYRILEDALQAAGCTGGFVYFELDWVVSAETVLRPDLLVVCGFRPEKFVEQTPTLVVEVLSDSTRQRDLLHKRAIYQEAGVRHYLIVDPRHGTHEMLSAKAGELVSNESSLVELHDGCRIELDLSELFP